MPKLADLSDLFDGGIDDEDNEDGNEDGGMDERDISNATKKKEVDRQGKGVDSSEGPIGAVND